MDREIAGEGIQATAQEEAAGTLLGQTKVARAADHGCRIAGSIIQIMTRSDIDCAVSTENQTQDHGVRNASRPAIRGRCGDVASEGDGVAVEGKACASRFGVGEGDAAEQRASREVVGGAELIRPGKNQIATRARDSTIPIRTRIPVGTSTPT